MLKTYDEDSSFNSYNIYQNRIELIKIQKMIVRSNCLDCLDRTNAFQAKYSFLMFYKMARQIDLFKNVKNEDSALKLLEQSENKFIKEFREVWADNGDIISLIYAGTGSTTSSVTRNGKNTNLFAFVDHGLKSINRYFQNNISDNFKNFLIESFVCSQKSPLKLTIDKKIFLHKFRPFQFSFIELPFDE